jgi:nucleotide-binding universal stress UspA family protein
MNDKKKILVPLDGTERSIHSIQWLKKMFKKDDVEITLMNVVEIVLMSSEVEVDKKYNAEKVSEDILEKGVMELPGYEVSKYSTFGYAADRILKKAKLDKFDMIVMTRSTKKGIDKMIGSVTTKVVKNAETLIVIVPE